MDELARFEWVASDLGDAACVAVVETDDVAAVARAYGGRLEQARRGPLREFPESSFFDDGLVALRRVGGWVLAIEINNYQGSRPEVMRRVAEGTRAVSAFWNVNADTQFAYAADGRVLTTFDLVSPQARGGAEPDCLEETRAGLPWETGDWVELMFALAARVTGQVFTREWLEGEFSVVPITEWEEDLPGRVYPEYESLTYSEPTLAYALRHADAAALRRAAVAAASHVVGTARLGNDPVVSQGLLGHGAVALSELVRTLGDRTQDDGWIDLRAVESVRALGHADPLTAAFKAVDAAFSGQRVAGADLSGVRGTVMRALGDPPPPVGSDGRSAPETGTPVERFAWVTRHWLGPSGDVTYVRTRDIAAVVRAHGRDPAAARTGPAALTDDRQMALRRNGDWVVVVQTDGAGYGDLPVMEALSRGGAVVRTGWRGNGSSLFRHLVDGRERTVFNVFSPQDASGDEPDGLRRHIADLGLPLEGNGTRQAPGLLALAERITGVALSPESLDGPHVLVGGAGG